jgi:hypothetical protein
MFLFSLANVVGPILGQADNWNDGAARSYKPNYGARHNGPNKWLMT